MSKKNFFQKNFFQYNFVKKILWTKNVKNNFVKKKFLKKYCQKNCQKIIVKKNCQKRSFVKKSFVNKKNCEKKLSKKIAISGQALVILIALYILLLACRCSSWENFTIWKTHNVPKQKKIKKYFVKFFCNYKKKLSQKKYCQKKCWPYTQYTGQAYVILIGVDIAGRYREMERFYPSDKRMCVRKRKFCPKKILSIHLYCLYILILLTSWKLFHFWCIIVFLLEMKTGPRQHSNGQYIFKAFRNDILTKWWRTL